MTDSYYSTPRLLVSNGTLTTNKIGTWLKNWLMTEYLSIIIASIFNFTSSMTYAVGIKSSYKDGFNVIGDLQSSLHKSVLVATLLTENNCVFI